MVIKLNNRGFLAITGSDRFTFLQGLVTNDVRHLEEKGILYTALLSPQGKYLYDFFLINQVDRILIDCYQDKLLAIAQRLRLYKLRSDVQLTDVSTTMSVTCSRDPQDRLGLADPRCEELGYRYYTSETRETSDDQTAYELACLELGIPGPEDMVEGKGIPLECGLDDLHAIGWSKGCYLGQELTARTKHRGLVRKRLLPVVFKGDCLPYGAEILNGETSAGQMRTSRNGLGIAMLRLESVDLVQKGRAALICDGREIQLKIPHWVTLQFDSLSSSRIEEPE